VTADGPLAFSDLPKLDSDDHVRLVHRTTGEYLVKRGGKAHAEMTCGHLEDTTFVGNPAWRVATAAQCRALGFAWCEECC
jgi:hypothetical protein